MIEIDVNTIEKVMSELEPMLMQMMQGMKTPGFQLAITNNQKILFYKSYGVRDLNNQEKMNADTIAMIGSCSKTYTALAIMQLVEKNKVSLDDPVSNFIPLTLDSSENPIQIHHLLTHTSGISDLGMSRLLITRLEGNSESDVPYTTWDDFYAHTNAAKYELVDLPGKRFIYCNTNYSLLAKVIEAVYGDSFENYMNENVFKPLKMTRSFYNVQNLSKFSNITTQYFQNGKATTPYYEPLIAGCGGVITTINDQVKFLQMLLNNGISSENQIITKDSLEKMEDLQARNNMATELIGDGLGIEAYGYGWMVFPEFCGTKIVDHTGSTGNGSANLLLCRDLNLGIVGIANNDAAQILLALSSFFLIATFMGKNPMTVFQSFILDNIYSKLAGKYHTYKDIRHFEMFHRNGLIFKQELTNQGEKIGNEQVLIPLSNNTKLPLQFYAYNGPGAKTVVEFSVNTQNNLQMFDGRYVLHHD